MTNTTAASRGQRALVCMTGLLTIGAAGCDHASGITQPTLTPQPPTLARTASGCANVPPLIPPLSNPGTTNTRIFYVVNAGFATIFVTANDAETGHPLGLGSDGSINACNFQTYGGWAVYTFRLADGTVLLTHAGPLPGPGGAPVPTEKPFVLNEALVPSELSGTIRGAVTGKKASASKFKVRSRSAANGVRG